MVSDWHCCEAPLTPQTPQTVGVVMLAVRVLMLALEGDPKQVQHGAGHRANTLNDSKSNPQKRDAGDKHLQYEFQQEAGHRGSSAGVGGDIQRLLV